MLPVDKSKTSIEGEYRTNLRVMFKEPYVSDAQHFDEDWLRITAKHHLQPNIRTTLLNPHTRYTKSSQEYRLNMESEKVRLSYSYSAPSTGLGGRRMNGEEKDMRPRSDLFLPLKARVPPEAIKLKEEAEKILKSVQEKDKREEDLPGEPVPLAPETRHIRNPSVHVSIFPDITLHMDDYEDDEFSTEKKASCWKSYEDFKKFKPPEKRPLPQELKSPHLSIEKCEEIWDWLNDYERIDDFSYFMEVCD